MDPNKRYGYFMDTELIKVFLIFLSLQITLVWPKPGSDVINGFLGTSAFQWYANRHPILLLKYILGSNMSQEMLFLQHI